MIFKKKLLVALLCSASFVALSACGGGGGSLTDNGGGDTPSPAEVFDPAGPAKATMAELPAPSASDEPVGESGYVTVFYYNTDEDRAALADYNLHLWEKTNDGSKEVQGIELNGGDGENGDWSNTGVKPVEVTNYGARFKLKITSDSKDVFYMIIRKPDGSTKVYNDDMGPYRIQDGRVLIVGGVSEPKVYESVSDAFAELNSAASDDNGAAADAVEGKVSIYVRSKGTSADDMAKLTLYTWEDGNIKGTTTICEGEDGWGCTKITPESSEEGLAIFRLDIVDAKGTFNFIVRSDGNATQTTDLSGDVSSTPINVTWDITSTKTGSATQSSNGTITPKNAAAIWINPNTIVSTNRVSYIDTEFARLYTGNDDDTVTGKDADGNLSGQYINLEQGSLTSDEAAAYPELAKGVESGKFMVWNIPAGDVEKAKGWIKKDLEFAGIAGNNSLTQYSKVQTAGVIDEVYGQKAFDAYNGKQLGAVVESGKVTFRLWAPTARSVSAVLYDKDKKLIKEVPLTADETGMWSAESADAKANETYYKYKVKVFRPDAMEVAEYEVTDPYSLALSTNSKFSLVADLDADSTKPADWDSDEPAYKQDSDQNLAAISITETHLRDITVGKDKGISDEHQGKYLGLTETGSVAVKHLAALHDAGMTHIELLPIYDFSTVDEEKGKTIDLNTTCAKAKEILGSEDDVCTADTVGAALIALAKTDVETNDPSKTHGVSDLLGKIKNKDSYNWGYDPFHYGVPEGSYATDPEGLTRTVELRQMIQSLHKNTGLNVVMDVVYNHTDGAGDPTKNGTSVLDAIVPWYYNRLDVVTGGVKAATCCKDSASEHKMFQKLMEDTLVTWVDQYHIDAFRFDLMGYIPKAVMEDTLKNVKERTGKSVFFFGEGWDPDGSASAKFEASTQKTMGGTGIGTFNDRIRDAVRGVGPFDHAGKTDKDAKDFMLSKKGFATGMCTSADVGTDGKARCSELGTDKEVVSSSANNLFARQRMDWIRVTMAGGISSYEFTDYQGNKSTGGNNGYWGSPVGYTEKPYETINYVSKHDNATLFDLITYTSTGDETMALQTRQQALGLATAILGQGVFFDQQGSDLLRSKSFENDSYNSGDFTNAVNYTDDETNGYGNGYSNESKDKDDWFAVKQLYAKTAKDPRAYNAGLQGKKQVMKKYYQELLSIRKNHKDFISLGSAEAIKNDVKFLNTGKDQTIGLIAMEITVEGKGKLLVAINATPDVQNLTSKGADAGYKLVDEQDGADSISKYNGAASTVSGVQPWSVAVFKK